MQLATRNIQQITLEMRTETHVGLYINKLVASNRNNN
jgi:hypothetical protein